MSNVLCVESFVSITTSLMAFKLLGALCIFETCLTSSVLDNLNFFFRTFVCMVFSHMFCHSTLSCEGQFAICAKLLVRSVVGV